MESKQVGQTLKAEPASVAPFSTLIKISPRARASAFGLRSGSSEAAWQDPQEQRLQESGIPRVSTRKIVPNPGVAKYQFVAAPKAVKVKNAKFADSSTGIDEEIM